MLERQRLVTYGISTTAAATIALALWLRPWQSGSLVTPPEPTPVTAVPAVAVHRVDIVFAVDTTASMGGLIEGAKRTVWSIASHVRELDPQADLHVGLVAYKDKTADSAYITKDFALTADLDGVFAELSSYTAQGGGDPPEDVDAGLYDAVHHMQWRDDAKRLVFLVGDAPPAPSRGDVQRYDLTVRDAAARGITINAIRCGDSAETAAAWQQIALAGHGEFSTIRQDGGVQQMATPYDDKLAKLSDTIDRTAVIYGDSGVHAGYEGKMVAAAAAPAPAKADRAMYFSKKSAPRAKEDILGGTMDVNGLEQDKLPSDLRGMSKPELRTELDRRAKERSEAQAELAKVAAQRDQYLRAHEAKGAAGSAAFDTAVKATVEHELE